MARFCSLSYTLGHDGHKSACTFQWLTSMQNANIRKLAFDDNVIASTNNIASTNGDHDNDDLGDRGGWCKCTTDRQWLLSSFVHSFVHWFIGSLVAPHTSLPCIVRDLKCLGNCAIPFTHQQWIVRLCNIFRLEHGNCGQAKKKGNRQSGVLPMGDTSQILG
ncbi:hypothetical protein BLOT_004096 [Blomia tropicalis]|nr:hypothetical protein BLOT_004096 [Blomia tropicalis]